MFEYVCKCCGEKFLDKNFSYHKKYCSRKCFETGRKQDTMLRNTFICKNCGVKFNDLKRKNRKFCSNKCKIENSIGSIKGEETIRRIKSSLLKNGITHKEKTYINKYGFVIITGSYKTIHSEIAKDVLGRELKFNEVVHHIDGYRTNNNNSNLVICERSLHPTIHKKTRELTKKRAQFLEAQNIERKV